MRAFFDRATIERIAQTGRPLNRLWVHSDIAHDWYCDPVSSVAAGARRRPLPLTAGNPKIGALSQRCAFARPGQQILAAGASAIRAV